MTERRIAAYMCRYTSLNTQKSVVEPRAYKITQGNKYDDDSWWYSLLSSTPNKNTNHTTAGVFEM